MNSCLEEGAIVNGGVVDNKDKQGLEEINESENESL